MNAGRARAITGVILATLTPATAFGQDVRGSVTSQAEGKPVPGAFVSLLDARGEPVASFLTDAEGTFRLRARSAGEYALRVRMIGFSTFTAPSFQLAAGEARVVPLTLSTEPISLAGITVSGERVCRFDAAEAAGAAALWDEAAKALEVLSWTDAADVLSFRIELTRRVTERGTGRFIQQDTDTVESVGARPFAVGDAETLFELGFVLPGADGGAVYYGPDAEMLLSERFLETHCFRTKRKDDEIGLEFEPKPDRGVTDLKGVLWLDQRTARLLRVEFSFAGGRAVTTGAGGDVEFRRLADGRWIIQRWRLRAPIVSGDPFSGRGSRLLGHEEAVGEVVEVSAATTRLRRPR
ncbi:MAG: carboxypeptidase-like regulatory domain-containing protein [Gemmatimonadota bacterium]